MARRKRNARPYGPGKFDTMLDAAIYEAMLVGPDEEAGSIDETGIWYGLMRDGEDIVEYLAGAVPSGEVDVTPEELAELAVDGKAGVIVTENDQGFVEVFYFKDKKDLEYEWQAIEEEMSEGDRPSGEDLVVRQRGDRWEVSEIEGRYRETFDSQREMEDGLVRKFKRENFYPIVWWHYERGDPTDVYAFEYVGVKNNPKPKRKTKKRAKKATRKPKPRGKRTRKVTTTTTKKTTMTVVNPLFKRVMR